MYGRTPLNWLPIIILTQRFVIPLFSIRHRNNPLQRIFSMVKFSNRLRKPSRGGEIPAYSEEFDAFVRFFFFSKRLAFGHVLETNQMTGDVRR